VTNLILDSEKFALIAFEENAGPEISIAARYSFWSSNRQTILPSINDYETGFGNSTTACCLLIDMAPIKCRSLLQVVLVPMFVR
jgi:hypothetical protein